MESEQLLLCFWASRLRELSTQLPSSASTGLALLLWATLLFRAVERVPTGLPDDHIAPAQFLLPAVASNLASEAKQGTFAKTLAACHLSFDGRRLVCLSCSGRLTSMSPPSMLTSTSDPTPSPVNYVLSFLIVGLCWGFTTPFIRKAAITYQTPSNSSVTDLNKPWLLRQIAKIFFSIIGLLRSPRYAIPLVLNLTGSIWFFLLVGKAGKF